jgi:poly(3-hydroxybutyrate) depolymerase
VIEMKHENPAWKPVPSGSRGTPELEVPTRLIKKDDEFEGVPHTWYEYFPESYDGSVAVPLVVVLHGGGRNGLSGGVQRSAWHQVADRENFIVVYPDATNKMILDDGTKVCEFNAFFMKGPYNDDVTYLKLLIERVSEIYHIDKSRIYMQGQSRGDQMVTHFALVHGKMLAAAAGTSGPTRYEIMKDCMDNLKEPVAPLPFYRWHGEKDDLGGTEAISRLELDDEHKKLWIRFNGCTEVPELMIDGRYNTEIYTGGQAEFRFTEFVGGDHSLDLSSANIIWKDFFSRFARDEDGNVTEIHSQEIKKSEGIALVAGCSHALVNGIKVKLHSGHSSFIPDFIKGDIPVPLDFIGKTFGVVVEHNVSTGEIMINYHGNNGTLKVDSPLLIINENVFYQLDTPPKMEHLGSVIPIKAIAELLCNWHVACSGKTFYISKNHRDSIDHYTEHILTNILK